MASSVVVGVRQRVAAFEPPLREFAALRSLQRSTASTTDASASSRTISESCGSVAIADAQVFQFVTFLLSAEGSRAYPDELQQLLEVLTQKTGQQTNQIAEWKTFSQWEDAVTRYLVAESPQDTRRVVVLVTYRPKQLLPLYMASARRAVRFVNAVVALVTANAYISTLGGGHFLCRHLNQSTLLAKLQIGISMGLKDPVLESKCRVNLMYNALQLGKFKRARRILRQEAQVAEQLDSNELRKVCHAANVYLDKMDRLHQEEVLFHRKGGRPATLHDNFYRQRIVRMTK